ncbi:MAG: hypothetical protein ACLP52_31305, partial [Streptosporangiaceae bacterium]
PMAPVPPAAGAPPAGGLRSAGLPGAGLPGAGLPGAGLPGAGLPGAGLPGAGLPGAGPPAAGLREAALPAAGLAGAGLAGAGPPAQARPARTAPAAAAPADFRGMLPPVSYGQPGTMPAQRPGDRPGQPAKAGPAGTGQPQSAAGAGRPAPAATRSPWSPLVIAAVAAAVALAVILPLVGTAAMLLMLLALRAGDLTASRVTRRRARQGRQGGGRLVAIAYFPLALARSVLRFALLSPLGLLLAAMAAAVTIVSVPAHPLLRAAAYAAGTLIAYYALGPGSGGSRRPLGAIFGRMTRGPAATVVTFVVVIALALAAVVTAVSQPAVFWPARHLSVQLAQQPGLHAVLTDIRQTLLRLASRFGL